MHPATWISTQQESRDRSLAQHNTGNCLTIAVVDSFCRFNARNGVIIYVSTANSIKALSPSVLLTVKPIIAADNLGKINIIIRKNILYSFRLEQK